MEKVRFSSKQMPEILTSINSLQWAVFYIFMDLLVNNPLLKSIKEILMNTLLLSKIVSVYNSFVHGKFTHCNNYD